MPGCLFHFCSEWRRARRVLQLSSLDAEDLGELLFSATSGFEIGHGSGLALHYGLAGHRVDSKEASAAGLANLGITLPTPNDPHMGRTKTDHDENKGGLRAAAGSRRLPTLVMSQVVAAVDEEICGRTVTRTRSRDMGSPTSPRPPETSVTGTRTRTKERDRPAAQLDLPEPDRFMMSRQDNHCETPEGATKGSLLPPLAPSTPNAVTAGGGVAFLRAAGLIGAKGRHQVSTQSESESMPSSPTSWGRQRTPRHKGSETEPMMRTPTSARGPSRGKSRTKYSSGSKGAKDEHHPEPHSREVFLEKSQLPQSLLLCNPMHPLLGMSDEYTKEDFVTEVRKRLTAERLFGSVVSKAKEGGRDPGKQPAPVPVFSTEDAELLYESLLLLQQLISGGSILRMGRTMDNCVEAFHALGQLRTFAEKGAASIAAFFAGVDLDDSKFIEPTELRHLLRRADPQNIISHGATVAQMEEICIAALDTNKDGKVELWELRRQLSLAAPPRLSLLELIGHLTMKYELSGKGGMSTDLTRRAFFDQMMQVESMDASPEDIIHLFHTATQGKKRYMSPSDLEPCLKQMPVEVSWGLEPYVTEQVYCALGTRCFTMERQKKSDACLPPEAMYDMENPLDVEDLRTNFDHLWECYAAGTTGLRESAEKQLRASCLRRFLEVAEVRRASKAASKARSQDATRAQVASSKGLRSLLPNITDVLATASTRLYSGQSCVIRYRLSGNSSFWPKEHNVVRNLSEKVGWPINRKVLGDTPFIGLVPRGLTFTSAGGGGFYNGLDAFTTVYANNRVDLPMDSKGEPKLYGTVELIAPSLIRTARGQVVADMELRLFCGTKQKIIGCIGEPLLVTVIHMLRPPALESLQVRLDGRHGTLRWSKMYLEVDADHVFEADNVRLLIRTQHSERVLTLDPDVTEWECPDLAPDTEYEFRARLENRAGPGREAVLHCRTNARCSVPGNLSCATTSTSHVDLRWQKPAKVGNEATQNHHQLYKESIYRYEATLQVQEEEEDKKASREGEDKEELEPDASMTRACQWTPDSWKEEKDGSVTARLSGLRPDTRYVLLGFCAVNSMGLGFPAKSLVFWTVPQTPQIATIRTRRGEVQVGLVRNGGICVKEYAVSVMKKGSPQDQTKIFKLPRTNLADSKDGGVYQELALKFDLMPEAEAHETHIFHIRASNAGGWSEWSHSYDTVAIARQQGADQAQVRLVAAMNSHRVEQLAVVLDEVRDIEFSDNSVMEEAKELLRRLKLARNDLTEAMQARDPVPLRKALDRAREVELPDLSKAESVLKKLEGSLAKLQTAKGIDALRQALRAAHEVRLPQVLLTDAISRLGTREAAQQGLEQAMEAARVPGLVAALETAMGMNLPSEEAAGTLLVALQRSEGMLKDALEASLIMDLEVALESVEESGLREDELIAYGRERLAELIEAREAAQQQLAEAMEARDPDVLREALEEAREAQVFAVHLDMAENLLNELEGLLKDVGAAEGVENRDKALMAAREAQVPSSLLNLAQVQLDHLIQLHDALKGGKVEVLRLSLRDGERWGLRRGELAEAKVVLRDWTVVAHEVEVASAVQDADRLERALSEAFAVGIHSSELAQEGRRLEDLRKRDNARVKLREAMQERKCDALQRAVKAACDFDVQDYRLVLEAQNLTEHLFQVKLNLQAAIDKAEPKILQQTIEEARKPPALPEKELEPALALLAELQAKESLEIGLLFDKLTESGDYRSLDALIDRARKSMQAGVDIDESELQQAIETAREEQEEERKRLELEMLAQRSKGVYTTHSEGTPQGSNSVELPVATVTGEIKVACEPTGKLVCRLPREIVEGSLIIALDAPECADAGASGTDATKRGYGICAQLVRAVRRLLDPQDDLRQISELPSLITYDSALQKRRSSLTVTDSRLEVGLAIYIRAPHGGVEVAKALCEGDQLGCDIWETNTDERAGSEEYTGTLGVALALAGQDAVAKSLASLLTQQIVRPMAMTGPRHPHPDTDPLPSSRRIADYMHNVRARVLRAVTVELTWHYPKGTMDSLDASCILFDEDKIVEIVDHRGMHGAKYGVAKQFRPGSETQAARGETIKGSVRHHGDHIDSENRRGKQTMQLRLDLVPKRVTDIFFVLSASNSRDLSKFADLQITLHDMEGKEALVTHDVPHPGNAEAVIMSNVYRLGDGQWCVNSFGTQTKGTSRDYRPILTKLLDLGYPRNVSLREQAVPVLKSVAQYLSLGNPVKATEVQIMRDAMRSFLKLRYCIELFSRNAGQGPDIVEDIAERSFIEAIGANLRDTAGERFSDEHIEVSAAKVRRLDKVSFELCWTYPTAPDHDAMAMDRVHSLCMGVIMSTDHRKEVDAMGRSHDRQSTTSSGLSKGSKNLLTSKRFSNRASAVTNTSANMAALGASASARASSHSSSHQAPSPTPSANPVLMRTSGKMLLNSGKPSSRGLNQLSDGKNYLDAACLVFEGQALREVVDYRGPHGVRIVSNGVLDYRGIWMGCVGTGDATCGAVRHKGWTMDDANEEGRQTMEINLGTLPENATELFLVLSSPADKDILQFGNLHSILCDAEDHGHQIMQSHVRVGDEGDESVLVCSMSRASGRWELCTWGCTSMGNARDYQPTILMLRAIQEHAYASTPPQWPHRVPRVLSKSASAMKPGRKMPRLPVVNGRMSSDLVDGNDDDSDAEPLAPLEPLQDWEMAPGAEPVMTNVRTSMGGWSVYSGEHGMGRMKSLNELDDMLKKQSSGSGYDVMSGSEMMSSADSDAEYAMTPMLTDSSRHGNEKTRGFRKVALATVADDD